MRLIHFLSLIGMIAATAVAFGAPPAELVQQQEGSWGVYRISLGEERALEIRFPHQPFVNESKETISYVTADSMADPIKIYGVSFYREPVEVTDPLGYLEKIMKSRALKPLRLLSYEISEADGVYLLDLCYGNEKTYVITKERHIVTEDNVYVLYTIFYGNDNHKYFIESFSLCHAEACIEVGMVGR